MPEFWECCNKRSISLLVVLYAEENGKLPPWYDDLMGKVRPSVNIESETWKYERELEVRKEMQQPPSNRLNREGK